MSCSDQRAVLTAWLTPPSSSARPVPTPPCSLPHLAASPDARRDLLHPFYLAPRHSQILRCLGWVRALVLLLPRWANGVAGSRRSRGESGVRARARHVACSGGQSMSKPHLLASSWFLASSVSSSVMTDLVFVCACCVPPTSQQRRQSIVQTSRAGLVTCIHSSAVMGFVLPLGCGKGHLDITWNPDDVPCDEGRPMFDLT